MFAQTGGLILITLIKALTVKSATDFSDCVNPKCKLIQTKNSKLALRSQRICEVTEVAVLLQILGISHARSNLAFISRSYADALACFSTLRRLILGHPPGHSTAQSGVVHDSRLPILMLQSGSHRLHLTGSCEVSSCRM